MITAELIDKLTEMLNQAHVHLTEAHEDFKRLLAENVDLHAQLAKLKGGGPDTSTVFKEILTVIDRSGNEGIYNWGAPLREIRAVIARAEKGNAQ